MARQRQRSSVRSGAPHPLDYVFHPRSVAVVGFALFWTVARAARAIAAVPYWHREMPRGKP